MLYNIPIYLYMCVFIYIILHIIQRFPRGKIARLFSVFIYLSIFSFSLYAFAFNNNIAALFQLTAER